MKTSKRLDLYESVTASIIAAIENMEQGEAYEMPWMNGEMEFPRNAAKGHFYRGINVLILWIEQVSRKLENPYWATYKQWTEMGAQVRKGEKSTTICFYNQYEKESESGEEGRKVWYMKAHRVFHVSQVEGWEAPAKQEKSVFESLADAEAKIAATGAVIQHGHVTAFYRPAGDIIGMPAPEHFVATKYSTAQENYYSTLLHELTHWTGAKHRLQREMGKRFGDHQYAFEELVAELGAAFACTAMGIVAAPRQDHAHYMVSWLKALKSDKKFIFTAASHAQKAVDYILRFSEPEAKKEAA